MDISNQVFSVSAAVEEKKDEPAAEQSLCSRIMNVIADVFKMIVYVLTFTMVNLWDRTATDETNKSSSSTSASKPEGKESGKTSKKARAAALVEMKEKAKLCLEIYELADKIEDATKNIEYEKVGVEHLKKQNRLREEAFARDEVHESSRPDYPERHYFDELEEDESDIEEKTKSELEDFFKDCNDRVKERTGRELDISSTQKLREELATLGGDLDVLTKEEERLKSERSTLTVASTALSERELEFRERKAREERESGADANSTRVETESSSMSERPAGSAEQEQPAWRAGMQEYNSSLMDIVAQLEAYGDLLTTQVIGVNEQRKVAVEGLISARTFDQELGDQYQPVDHEEQLQEPSAKLVQAESAFKLLQMPEKGVTVSDELDGEYARLAQIVREGKTKVSSQKDANACLLERVERSKSELEDALMRYSDGLERKGREQAREAERAKRKEALELKTQQDKLELLQELEKEVCKRDQIRATSKALRDLGQALFTYHQKMRFFSSQDTLSADERYLNACFAGGAITFSEDKKFTLLEEASAEFIASTPLDQVLTDVYAAYKKAQDTSSFEEGLSTLDASSTDASTLESEINAITARIRPKLSAGFSLDDDISIRGQIATVQDQGQASLHTRGEHTPESVTRLEKAINRLRNGNAKNAAKVKFERDLLLAVQKGPKTIEVAKQERAAYNPDAE